MYDREDFEFEIESMMQDYRFDIPEATCNGLDIDRVARYKWAWTEFYKFARSNREMSMTDICKSWILTMVDMEIVAGNSSYAAYYRYGKEVGVRMANWIRASDDERGYS